MRSHGLHNTISHWWSRGSKQSSEASRRASTNLWWRYNWATSLHYLMTGYYRGTSICTHMAVLEPMPYQNVQTQYSPSVSAKISANVALTSNSQATISSTGVSVASRSTAIASCLPRWRTTIPVALPSPCVTVSTSPRRSIREQVLVMQKRTDYKNLPFGIDV